MATFAVRRANALLVESSKVFGNIPTQLANLLCRQSLLALTGSESSLFTLLPMSTAL